VATAALAGTVLVALVIDVGQHGGAVGPDALPGAPSAWCWGGLVAVGAALGALWVVAYSVVRVVTALLAAPVLIDEVLS
jgi:hypothetical protein